MKANKRSHQLLHNDVLSRKPRRILALMGLAPLPVAPVNETALVLLPQGLKAWKQVAKQGA